MNAEHAKHSFSAPFPTLLTIIYPLNLCLPILSFTHPIYNILYFRKWISLQSMREGMQITNTNVSALTGRMDSFECYVGCSHSSEAVLFVGFEKCRIHLRRNTISAIPSTCPPIDLFGSLSRGGSGSWNSTDGEKLSIYNYKTKAKL